MRVWTLTLAPLVGLLVIVVLSNKGVTGNTDNPLTQVATSMGAVMISDFVGPEHKGLRALMHSAPYPPIPKWLATMAELPDFVAAYALPNGQFAIDRQAAYPLDFESFPGLRYTESFLYDAGGELLPAPHYNHGSMWEGMFWGDKWPNDSKHYHPTMETDFPNEPLIELANYTFVTGYTVFFDPDTRTVLEVWDFNGTVLYDIDKDGPICPLTVRPVRYCEELNSHKVLQIYRSQQ